MPSMTVGEQDHPGDVRHSQKAPESDAGHARVHAEPAEHHREHHHRGREAAALPPQRPRRERRRGTPVRWPSNPCTSARPVSRTTPTTIAATSSPPRSPSATPPPVMSAAGLVPMPTHGPTRRSHPSCPIAPGYGPPVRRDDLAALGIQLPVLPTIVLGALPGAPDWSARLASIGLDVTASGADEDTGATLAAARDAAPHLAVKARIADAGALDGDRAMIVETEGPVPPHLYR